MATVEQAGHNLLIKILISVLLHISIYANIYAGIKYITYICVVYLKNCDLSHESCLCSRLRFKI